jgi:hypothetical protein
VLQALDLVDIAGAIDAPYHPEPLIALGAVAVSLVIYEGPKSWHHAADHDELLVVLEGVLTIDGPDGTLVVNEGEVVRVPALTGLDYNSGMHSTAVLIQERKDPAGVDGHEGPPLVAPVGVDKTNFAVDVLRANAFVWQRVGVVGGHVACATRLRGASAPYVTPDGTVAALVYRGVLECETSEGVSSVVGSQLLIVPGATEIRLRSERGATVVVVLPAAAPLPQPVGRQPEDGTDLPAPT